MLLPDYLSMQPPVGRESEFMSIHYTFHREIERLKARFLVLSTLVEDRVRKACAIIETRDPALINFLLTSDWEVDEMEIEIEEECLKILALHQPVARDLRLLVAIIKINNEIERIGDIAVNIAKRVDTINRHATRDFQHDYGPMCERAVTMLKMSLDAMVQQDCDLARRVFLVDEEVDRFRNEAYNDVIEAMDHSTGHASYLLNTYLLARHLERIGDRAKNIAEEVIYLVEGEIVRGDHGGEKV